MQRPWDAIVWWETHRIELIVFLFCGLLLSSAHWSAAQSKDPQLTSISAKEKDGQQEVVKALQTLRQQKGLPKLRQINDPLLRKDACESAKRGRGTGSLYNPLDPTKMWIPSGIFGDVGNLSTFSYMASDPSQTPPDLQTWATQMTYQSRTPYRVAVGVCFISTSQHPEGTYWIDVGYYMDAVKTFLYRVTFMWD